MVALVFEHAMLPSGWARQVRIEIAGDGSIAAVASGEATGATIRGAAVPGMANVHSHAFQRAMAGLAERAGPRGDSFWSWREIMYRFLARLGPEDVEAIAAQLYVELVTQGYTAVGEFHYLHNDPSGAPYARREELAERIIAAARASAIGLTLLPVLYQQGNFGGVAPGDGQRRFLLDDASFAAMLAELHHRHRADASIRIGVAPHSLRAVSPGALRAALEAMRALDADAPVHLHAAEQIKEVDDCLAWSGARPIEWLLDHAPVDARWCLVHATQSTPAERAALARRGATVGLCPSTEANLGDGLFALPEFLAAGGRFAIGGDANVSTSPAEELRLLEYGQRLTTRRRNLTESAIGASTGAALYRRALAGGAAALGRPIGALAPGHRADIVVLDLDHPALAGRLGDLAIDSWIFSGNTTPVRDVMIGGAWIVRDGRHAREAAIAAAYRRCAARLTAGD